MKRRRTWRSTSLIALLPAVTFATGVAPLLASDGQDHSQRVHFVAAVAVAAAAPLLITILLSRFAIGFDGSLVAIAAMLTSLGMTLQGALALESITDRAFFSTIAIRHGYFIGAGFVALLVGALVATRLESIVRYPYTTLLAALAMIAATVVFGDAVNGARLWLQAGPVRFQPSEVARLLLVVFLVTFLHEHRHFIVSPWRVGAIDLPPAPYLAPLVGAVLSAVLVLFLQNDLGMAALIVLGAFAIVTSAIRTRTVTAAAATIIGLSATAAYFGVSRVRDRVATWLDPWANPLAGGFQFVQSEYGLAASGLLGNRQGSMSTQVPEIQTDFVLVGVGDRFGVAVAAAVLALSGLLVVRCAMNALRGSDSFRRHLAFALSTLLGLQIVLIAGGTLRLLPLTGVTFPLVSYGGTSMIVTLFALGVIVGIGAENTTWSKAAEIARETYGMKESGA